MLVWDAAACRLKLQTEPRTNANNEKHLGGRRIPDFQGGVLQRCRAGVSGKTPYLVDGTSRTPTSRNCLTFHIWNDTKPAIKVIETVRGALWVAKEEAKLRIRILIVDDEAAVLDALTRILQLEGFEVQTASNADTALDFLAAAGGGPVDLMITDYRMPGRDGLVLAREVRQILPRLPIVLMTGSLVNVAEKDMERLGISFVLRKPFRVAQVRNLVRDLLRLDPVASIS